MRLAIGPFFWTSTLAAMRRAPALAAKFLTVMDPEAAAREVEGWAFTETRNAIGEMLPPVSSLTCLCIIPDMPLSSGSRTLGLARDFSGACMEGAEA